MSLTPEFQPRFPAWWRRYRSRKAEDRRHEPRRHLDRRSRLIDRVWLGVVTALWLWAILSLQHQIHVQNEDRAESTRQRCVIIALNVRTLEVAHADALLAPLHQELQPLPYPSSAFEPCEGRPAGSRSRAAMNGHMARSLWFLALLLAILLWYQSYRSRVNLWDAQVRFCNQVTVPAARDSAARDADLQVFASSSVRFRREAGKEELAGIAIRLARNAKERSDRALARAAVPCSNRFRHPSLWGY